MDKTQSGLKKFQENFVDGITKNKTSQDFLDQIIPVAKLTTEGVLNVYRNDYTARLTEAIGETFETTWAVLGDRDFLNLCREFIEKRPSTFRELGEYSRGFAAFVKSLSNIDYPFLSDLLDFELAFWNLFHLKNEGTKVSLDLSLNELLECSFVFTKNIKLFKWDYKIFELWKHRKVGLSELEEDIYQKQNLILFKTSSFVEAFELSEVQISIFEKLLVGQNLNDILEQVDVNPQEISDLFFKLNSNKLILSFL